MILNSESFNLVEKKEKTINIEDTVNVPSEFQAVIFKNRYPNSKKPQKN